MRAEELQRQIAAARAYEELHVPALFQQWVAPVLDAARIEAGQQVLDVACGTGVLGRQAVVRVTPTGRVFGIDPDPGMLAVAAELAPTVQWRQATAESLPFADGDFDAVVCQFGLMFFADQLQALKEMFRVLAPGGRAAVAVWDSLENSAAYPVEVELLERLAGSAAADALRAPFVLGDVSRTVELFESAGWTAVEVETRTGEARFPSVRSMVAADLQGWLPVMGVELEKELISLILQEAEQALKEYVTHDGRAVFESPAHIISGKKSAGESPSVRTPEQGAAR